MEDLKKVITAELAKCAVDPVYFMRKYCKIQHSTRGTLPFNLYPFQEELLHSLQEHRFNIILKSRQLGITTVAAGYSLWLMMFHPNTTIACMGIDLTTSKGMVDKVKFMWNNLPNWMKGKNPKPENENTSLLKLKNQSQIIALTSSSNKSRQLAVSFFIIDEAAFISDIEATYTALKPTLTTGGRCLALSSPNGIGNWFHKTWTKALEKSNNFHPTQLPWTVHPERDQAWFDYESADMTPQEIAQEYECDFIASGNNVIPMDLIQEIEKLTVCDPIETRYGNDLWMWKRAELGKKYMITADVSRGDGADFSAFQVLDSETCEQVAEFRGKIDTRMYAQILMAVGYEYNTAFIAVENSNMGWDVVKSLEEANYSNMYYSPKGDSEMNVFQYLNKIEKGMKVPGFSNTQKTRPLLVAKLQSYLRDKSIIIRSRRLIEELKVFAWINGKAQSQNGYNDDLILSLSIGLYLRDTALSFNEYSSQMSQVSIANIGKAQSYITNNNSNYMRQDPWSMKDGFGNNHDLTWLIG